MPDSRVINAIIFSVIALGISIPAAFLSGLAYGGLGRASQRGLTGDTGPPGDTGTTGISFVFRGEWLSLTTYYFDNVVSYLNSSYVCNVSSVSSMVPPTTDSSWLLFVPGGTCGSCSSSSSSSDLGNLHIQRCAGGCYLGIATTGGLFTTGAFNITLVASANSVSTMPGGIHNLAQTDDTPLTGTTSVAALTASGVIKTNFITTPTPGDELGIGYDGPISFSATDFNTYVFGTFEVQQDATFHSTVLTTDLDMSSTSATITLPFSTAPALTIRAYSGMTPITYLTVDTTGQNTVQIGDTVSDTVLSTQYIENYQGDALIRIGGDSNGVVIDNLLTEGSFTKMTTLAAVGTPSNANAATAGVPIYGLYRSTADPCIIYIRTA